MGKRRNRYLDFEANPVPLQGFSLIKSDLFFQERIETFPQSNFWTNFFNELITVIFLFSGIN